MTITQAHVAQTLALQLDPAHSDVRQPLRDQAAGWAAAWFALRPDALILMGCNGRARNADHAHRHLRLRRLQTAMARHGVPADRIRFTTDAIVTPVCDQAGERGVAWCRVMTPEDLEVAGVQPIATMLTA